MALAEWRGKFATFGEHCNILQRIPGIDTRITTRGPVHLINQDYDGFKLLHNIGESPSIKSLGFDYQGRFPPYHAQDVTASFMAARSRLWCLNGMGSGKTAASIWAAQFLQGEQVYKRILILAPLSVLQSVWEHELLGIMPDAQPYLTLKTYKAKEKFIKRIKSGGLRYVIANHDKIMHWYEELMLFKPELIILDEGSLFRSANTNRYRALEAAVKIHGANLWVLTGTPCPKAPTDVWPLCRLINPEGINTNFYAWRNKTMFRVNGIWLKRRDAQKHIDAAMQPCIRISRESSVDIPPVTYQDRVVSLSKDQMTACNQLKDEAFMRVDGLLVSPPNYAVLMSKLLEIYGGWVKAEGGVINLHPNERLSELHDVIADNGRKFIIPSWFVATHEPLKAFLKTKGYNVGSICGKTPVKQRYELAKKFQETDEYDGLVLQPKTAGYGLNLTAANIVIWWSIISIADVYEQCNDRNRRAGQKHPCTVVHLTSGGIERRIRHTLSNRLGFQQVIMDLKQSQTDDFF